MSFRGSASGQRHLAVAAAGLMAAAVLFGTGGSGSRAGAAAASDQTITAHDKDTNFDPATVAITPGESVPWTFVNPNEAHNVPAASPNWTTTDGPARPNHPPLTITFPNA